jgi:hypothetical protein
MNFQIPALNGSNCNTRCMYHRLHILEQFFYDRHYLPRQGGTLNIFRQMPVPGDYPACISLWLELLFLGL